MLKKLLTVLFLSLVLVGCSTNNSNSNSNDNSDKTSNESSVIPTYKETTIDIRANNFNSFKDKVTFEHISENTQYGNITFASPDKGTGVIKSNKLKDIKNISFEVFNTFDNIDVYDNFEGTGTPLVAKSTQTRSEGDKQYVTYNYDMKDADAFKLVNNPDQSKYATYLTFIKITYMDSNESVKPTPTPDPKPNPDTSDHTSNDSTSYPEYVPGELNVKPSVDVNSFYANTNGKEGINLYGALNSILNNNKHVGSYGALPGYYEKTDAVKKNGQIKIIDFYTHELMDNYHDWNNNWNREHVWPKSLGSEENQAESDLHHVRPDWSKLNGFRSNHKYGDNNGQGKVCPQFPNSECYLKGDVFEPNDVSKGDCARIVVYCAVTYNMNIRRVMAGSDATIKATLLEWNSLDPVDDIEMIRNNEAQKIQGNRNAFIDRPDLFEKIVNNGLLNR